MIEINKHDESRQYSILAVDDERANLNLLRRTFRQEYNLYLAEDGLSGLNILREQPIDLIISDQRMPQMTGIEMLAKSREIVPDAVRMILTAYTEVNDIIDAINKGHIYRYILKPWSPDELKITVAKSLEHYRLAKENAELVVKLRQSLIDLKNAQQELLHRERLSTLGRMASTIIHDLKLPMSNIRTSAALLAKQGLNDNLRIEFSSIIMKEVDRLVEMTREILEFSRGETKLNMQDFLFESLLEEVFQQIERDFKEVGVLVRKDWDYIGPFTGDIDRLRRVLLNLSLNARDAMPNGGTLTLHSAAEDDKLIIRIEDTGHGIPEDIIDKIFDPFFTHGKHDGTGLGMTISRKIIEAHQGQITARNRIEGGAAIEINLPRNRDG